MSRAKTVARFAKMKTELAYERHFWPWQLLDGKDTLLSLQALCTPGRTPEELAERLVEDGELSERYDLDELVDRLDVVQQARDAASEFRIPGRLTHKLAKVLGQHYSRAEIDDAVERLVSIRGADDLLVLTLLVGIQVHLGPIDELRARIGSTQLGATRTYSASDWRPDRIWCERMRSGDVRLSEIETAIQYADSRPWVVAQVEAVGLFHTAPTAELMWRLFKARGKATAPARSWLFAHPELSAPVLRSLNSSAAKRLLRSLEARVGGPDAADSWVREGAIGEALTAQKAGRLPQWLHPADLVPLLIDGRPLDLDDTARVLTALKKSTIEYPQPLIAALVDASGNEHRFAWSLFETWLESGAPSKDVWVLWALGLFGNDLTALKLGPMMKAWPRQSQNARALKGLQVLQAIGTDSALTTLAAVARTAGTASLKGHANVALEAIAERRGLGVEDLQDRIVPDCGLRDDRVLSYGERSFTIVFRPDLKLGLIDPEGAFIAGPPRRKKGEDAAVIAEVKETWKIRKKVLSATLKDQRQRLRHALAEGRSWSPDSYREVLLGHPILREIAARLLWLPEDGEAFRIAEDGSFADIDDVEVELPGSPIRLLHPVDLPAEEIAEWVEICSDYELIPPFEQLGRRCRRLADDERELYALALGPATREAWQGWAILGRSGWERRLWAGPLIRSFPHYGGWEARIDGGESFGDEVPTRIQFGAFEGAPLAPLAAVPARLLSEAWRSVAGAFGEAT